MPLSPAKLFTATEALNLVPLPPAMLPNTALLDDSYRFFTPPLLTASSHRGEPPPEPDGRPYLYVCMGSTPLNNRPDLYRTVIDTFGHSDWFVLMSIGETPADALGAIPDNVAVRTYVPQIEALRHADVFLTHGGMNSVLESCQIGVPMIVAAIQPETRVTARLMQARQMGFSVDPAHLSPHQLRQAAERLYSDPLYATNLRLVQEQLRDLPGPPAVVDALERHAAGAGSAADTTPRSPH